VAEIGSDARSEDSALEPGAEAAVSYMTCINA